LKMDGILIVDDEELILETMADALEMDGLGPIFTESDPRLVEQRIEEFSPGVMLLDLTMPGRSGLDVLESIRSTRPDIQVIVVTGNADVESAVTCLRAGASDYLIKAVERNRLVTAVKRALEIRDLERENHALRRYVLPESVSLESPFPYIISRDPGMLDILAYVRDIAVSTRPIMITGETGTGKELMARAAHESSGRTGSLVAVNVSGYDDSMFSDTLFGHVKGAFTGADVSRKGLIEEAAGGTLFLDEIGDLSEASQVKLLRLLDSGEFRPVGGDTVKRSRAVIVAATNKALEKPECGFRRDLFYRLSSHVVRLPSLSDRRNDIPSLVTRFIGEAAEEFEKPTITIDDAAMHLLSSRRYPGNIRELRSLVFDAVGRCKEKRLGLENFPSEGSVSTAIPGDVIWSDFLPTLRGVGEMLVNEAMQRSGRNQTAAAKLLGITQPALNKRLKKTALEDQ
jgi:DNA-binding NtrC family response regulator